MKLWKENKRKKECGECILMAKVGVGAGVYIISSIRDFKTLSYKLTFECTNNVLEYEALLLGFHALKDLGAKRVQVFADLELVIN